MAGATTTASEGVDAEHLKAELLVANSQLTAHERLTTTFTETATCQICLDLLYRPYTLSPCGHVSCYNCLVSWFTAPPPSYASSPPAAPPPAAAAGPSTSTNGAGPSGSAQSANPNPNPNPNPPASASAPRPNRPNVIGRTKTCPHCRAKVRGRPAEAWLVKELVQALVDSGLSGVDAVAATVTANASSADPWSGIFLPETTRADPPWAARRPWLFARAPSPPPLIPRPARANGVVANVNANGVAANANASVEERGMLDEEDGGIYRCVECVHEIWAGRCTGCRRVYPAHPGYRPLGWDFGDTDEDEDEDADEYEMRRVRIRLDGEDNEDEDEDEDEDGEEDEDEEDADAVDLMDAIDTADAEGEFDVDEEMDDIDMYGDPYSPDEDGDVDPAEFFGAPGYWYGGWDDDGMHHGGEDEGDGESSAAEVMDGYDNPLWMGIEDGDGAGDDHGVGSDDGRRVYMPGFGPGDESEDSGDDEDQDSEEDEDEDDAWTVEGIMHEAFGPQHELYRGVVEGYRRQREAAAAAAGVPRGLRRAYAFNEGNASSDSEEYESSFIDDEDEQPRGLPRLDLPGGAFIEEVDDDGASQDHDVDVGGEDEDALGETDDGGPEVVDLDDLGHGGGDGDEDGDEDGDGDGDESSDMDHDLVLAAHGARASRRLRVPSSPPPVRVRNVRRLLLSSSDEEEEE